MTDITDKLEIVTTTRQRYLGHVKEEGTAYHLERATLLPEDVTTASEIALIYYAEKSRRNLHDYLIPLTAVESRMHNPHVDRMVASYIELAKVANKGVYGKAKATRLKKFLKNIGGEK